MSRCDRSRLLAYLEGRLTGTEMDAFECHAAECQECSEELELRLAATKDLMHRSIHLETVPSKVHERVARLDERRTGLSRGFTPLIAIAAVFTLILIWNGQGTKLTHVHGTVFVDGRPWHSGSAVRDGSRITTIGRASLKLVDRQIYSPYGWNEFTVSSDNGSWTLKEQVGPLEVSHQGKPDGFAVRLQGRTFVPLGTRFLLVPDSYRTPRLDVYEKSVEVQTASNSQLVSEGQSWHEDKRIDVADDPFTAVGKPLPLIPLFAGTTPKLGGDPARGLPAEIELGLKGATNIPESEPSRYCRIAMLLTFAEERRAASFAIQKMLELDPHGVRCSIADLTFLMEGQAAFDGSATLAVRLAHVLNERDTSFQLGFWRSLIDGPRLRDRFYALKNLLPNLSATGRLAALATLIKAANDATDSIVEKGERDLVRKAAVPWLKDLIKQGFYGQNRPLARAYGVLAEAQYFSGGGERDSLRSLSEEAALWPRADVRIHLAARHAEAGNVSELDGRNLAEAFACDPTFDAAARVLTFLRDSGEAEEGRFAIESFARWIGETYRSVPEAQALAAEHLYLVDPMIAYAFLKRAISIWPGGMSSLPVHHRVFAAGLLWRLRGRVPESQAEATATSIAKECALFNSGSPLPQSHEFFAVARSYELALKAVDASNPADPFVSFLRAKYLRELGRDQQAIDALHSFLAHSDSLEDWHAISEAQLSLAELTANTNKKLCKELASDYLKRGGTGLDSGWRKSQHWDMRFRARAFWLVGDQQNAIRLMRQYLNLRAWNPDYEEDEQLLKSWEICRQK